jgi:hypothetical protein
MHRYPVQVSDQSSERWKWPSTHGWKTTRRICLWRSGACKGNAVTQQLCTDGRYGKGECPHQHQWQLVSRSADQLQDRTVSLCTKCPEHLNRTTAHHSKSSASMQQAQFGKKLQQIHSFPKMRLLQVLRPQKLYKACSPLQCCRRGNGGGGVL